MLSIIHTVLGFTSLISGFFVLLQVKGTKTHRFIGRFYALSMISLCVSSFGLFNLFGRFGIFHISAIISLVSVFAGITCAIFKSKIKNWLKLHYECMSWSYLGLLAATVNEIFANIPLFTQAATDFKFLPLIVLFVL